MTEAEINADLKDVRSWVMAPDNVRKAFVEEIEPCRYGQDPLRQAWCWFSLGWYAGRDDGVQ